MIILCITGMKNALLLLIVVALSGGLYANASKKRYSPYYKMQQERGIKVEGIYISKSRRVALINGTYYIVEDIIPGRGELVAILKDRIVIDEETGLEVYQMLKN